MKRIFASFLLVLLLGSLVFSLTGCKSAEDIKGVRQTESILQTNYYETTLYDDAKDLEKLGAGASDYLKSYLKAENKKGETIIICSLTLPPAALMQADIL